MSYKFKNFITPKDYVTIAANGVTVDGTPVTTYYGAKIRGLEFVPRDFKKIQEIVKHEYGIGLTAVRVMSSTTFGLYAMPGEPYPRPGNNTWVQCVFANGIESPWMFVQTHWSSAGCAEWCVPSCVECMLYKSDFRSSVFEHVTDIIKRKSQQTGKSLLSHNFVNMQGIVR